MRLRAIALWGNLLYAIAVVIAMAIALGLGAAPARAYVNVAIFMVMAAAAGILNVRCLRRRQWSAESVAAIVLNTICLGYIVPRPEFAHALLGVAVALIPVLNVVVIVGDRRAASGPAASINLG